MNRADAKIAARDLITVNILTALFDEETGQAYRDAVRAADTEIERAFREREEKEIANVKKLFEKGSGGD